MPVLKYLFQVGRELFLNVVKHARARCAEVTLHYDEAGVSLMIGDDGVGVAAPRPHAHIRDVKHALHERAAGYLVKTALVNEIGEALRRVLAGEVYLSSALSSELARDYARQARGERCAPAVREALATLCGEKERGRACPPGLVHFACEVGR